MSATFRYDKENLYKEFADAKAKDVKLSKLETLDEQENDYFTNRLKFCVEHKELKKSNPHYYENVSVNFDALENAYRTVNPRDTFYQVGFGMTYAMKKSLESQELEININKEE
tara:strand:+ start:2020 stop:2358 length:339 start_codon:yes stop_codon:yes gene_type:complete